jgi:hypothetical protein
LRVRASIKQRGAGYDVTTVKPGLRVSSSFFWSQWVLRLEDGLLRRSRSTGTAILIVFFEVTVVHMLAGGWVLDAPLLTAKGRSWLIESPLRRHGVYGVSLVGTNRLDGHFPSLCIDELNKSLVVSDWEMLME